MDSKWIYVDSDSQPGLLLYATPPAADLPLDQQMIKFEVPVQMFIEWHQQLHDICTVADRMLIVTHKRVIVKNGCIGISTQTNELPMYSKRIVLGGKEHELNFVDVSTTATWLSANSSVIRSIDHGDLTSESTNEITSEGYMFVREDDICVLVEVMGLSAVIIDTEEGHEIRATKIA